MRAPPAPRHCSAGDTECGCRSPCGMEGPGPGPKQSNGVRTQVVSRGTDVAQPVPGTRRERADDAPLQVHQRWKTDERLAGRGPGAGAANGWSLLVRVTMFGT